MDQKTSFWSSLPGVLTGCAALLTAGSGLYIATRTTPAPAPLVPEAQADVRPAPAAANLRTAVIIDPDGFVNVRTGPASSTAIAGVIRDGEIFTVIPASAGWWQVRTNNGTTGYVHKSRGRLR